jgi:SAM-dependent methyltransferase
MRTTASDLTKREAEEKRCRISRGYRPISKFRSRLRTHGDFDLGCGDFLELEFPRSDLIVASFSLHHISDPDSKKRLYARCRRALGSDGALLMADCYPPSLHGLAKLGRAAWRRHLEQYYTAQEARRYLEAWSEEDTHFEISDELEWLKQAGFRTEVVWRRELFSVLACT